VVCSYLNNLSRDRRRLIYYLFCVSSMCKENAQSFGE
jgi:hypothetical protein